MYVGTAFFLVLTALVYYDSHGIGSSLAVILFKINIKFQKRGHSLCPPSTNRLGEFVFVKLRKAKNKAVLSAVRCMEVTRHQACVSAKGPPVRVTCSGRGERIRVDRVVYSAYNNLSPRTGCDVGELESSCKVDNPVASQSGYRNLIRSCYDKQSCSLIFGDAGEDGCGSDGFNHVLMHYSCVPTNRLLDLCENLRRNITTTTQLSYFSTRREVPRDCKCVVTGGYHVVRVISVELPFETRNCTKISLTIASDMRTTKMWEAQGLSSGEDPIKAQSSSIQFVRNCNYGETIVWLEILPDPNVSLSLNCGHHATEKPLQPTSTPEQFSSTKRGTSNHKITAGGANTRGTTQTAINTEQSSATTEKVTTAGAAAGEVTEPEPNTGVVAGAALGGAALVVSLVVLAVVLCKKRRHKGRRDPDYSLSRRATTNPYKGVVDDAKVIDNNAFVMDKEDDYGGYHTIDDMCISTANEEVDYNKYITIKDSDLEIPAIQEKRVQISGQSDNENYNRVELPFAGIPRKPGQESIGSEETDNGRYQSVGKSMTKARFGPTQPTGKRSSDVDNDPYNSLDTFDRKPQPKQRDSYNVHLEREADGYHALEKLSPVVQPSGKRGIDVDNDAYNSFNTVSRKPQPKHEDPYNVHPKREADGYHALEKLSPSVQPSGKRDNDVDNDAYNSFNTDGRKLQPKHEDPYNVHLEREADGYHALEKLSPVVQPSGKRDNDVDNDAYNSFNAVGRKPQPNHDEPYNAHLETEADGYHTLEKPSSSDTAAAGNTDQPRTPISGIGMPKPKTTNYDHIASLPNTNKKIAVSGEDLDHRNEPPQTNSTDDYGHIGSLPNANKKMPISGEQRIDDRQRRLKQGEITSDDLDKRMSEPKYAKVSK